MNIINGVLRLFFPPKCIVCDEILEYFSKYPFCKGCQALLNTGKIMLQAKFPLKHIDALYVMYDYSNKSVKSSVYHAKKMFSWQFSDFFADSCLEFFEKFSIAENTDLITFATRRTSEKLREGIDQSEQMAKTISRVTGIPWAKTLKRTRKSQKQRQLSNIERAENVKGLFATLRDVKNKRIMLVDDVMTTGSTVSDCARALKEGGAKSVTVVIFSS